MMDPGDMVPGSFSVTVLPYPYETGCRSTIHCANFGFCNRCNPQLAEASSHVLKAMQVMERQSDGQLYEAMMNLLKGDAR